MGPAPLALAAAAESDRGRSEFREEAGQVVSWVTSNTNMPLPSGPPCSHSPCTPPPHTPTHQTPTHQTPTHQTPTHHNTHTPTHRHGRMYGPVHVALHQQPGQPQPGGLQHHLGLAPATAATAGNSSSSSSSSSSRGLRLPRRGQFHAGVRGVQQHLQQQEPTRPRTCKSDTQTGQWLKPTVETAAQLHWPQLLHQRTWVIAGADAAATSGGRGALFSMASRSALSSDSPAATCAAVASGP